MTKRSKDSIKNYFRAGDIPSEAQYKDFIDSNTFLDESNTGNVLINGHFSSSGDIGYIGNPISCSGLNKDSHLSMGYHVGGVKNSSVFHSLYVTHSINKGSVNYQDNSSSINNMDIGAVTTTVSPTENIIGISHAGQAGHYGYKRSMFHCPIQYDLGNDSIEFRPVTRTGSIVFSFNNTENGTSHSNKLVIQTQSISLGIPLSSSFNISSSANIIGKTGSFDFVSNPNSNVGFDNITVDSNATINGYVIVATNVTASGNISSSAEIISNVGTFTTITNVNTTHITASGNISSSGTIIADSFTSTGGNVGGINFSDGVLITGSITASDNISSSATIQGSTGSFDYLTSTNFVGSRPIQTKTANGALVIGDKGTYNRCGPHKLTIPLNSAVAFEIGTEIDFIQTSSHGHLLITASAGDAVTLNSRYQIFSASGKFSAVSCKKVGTDEWDIIGDLTA